MLVISAGSRWRPFEPTPTVWRMLREPELIGAGHQVVGLARSDASAADADRRAIDTFGEALAGSHRPFLIASGTLGLAPGQVATERDGQGSGPIGVHRTGGPAKRMANAHATAALADRGVLAEPVVDGVEDHGDVRTAVGLKGHS